MGEAAFFKETTRERKLVELAMLKRTHVSSQNVSISPEAHSLAKIPHPKAKDTGKKFQR